MANASEVCSFYKDRTIFITGSTGFMGKMLIWKLLRNCPQLSRIYVLLRDKKGKSANQRLHELLDNLIFTEFWDEDVSQFEKVKAVSGDITVPGLGVTEEMKNKLTNEVQIVFHLAATTNLNNQLKNAINMNTLGTLHLLKLATQMKNLVVFAHTSTAFCHCDVEVLEEKIYPAPEDPLNIIDLVNRDQYSEKDYHNIWQPHPNTYTYSKRLAEKLVANYYPQLPVVIVRPSIVITSLREPIAGWSSSLNDGLTGLLPGIGAGIVRSIEGGPNYRMELIPVDAAICSIIVIACKVPSNPLQRDVPVYNVTQGDLLPVTLREMIRLVQNNVRDYAFEKCLWYPRVVARPNKLLHAVAVFRSQWIPAYLIDTALHIFGQKTFMVKTQRRIQQGFSVFSYFMTHEWNFKNDKTSDLLDSLSEEDATTFYYYKPETIDTNLVVKNGVLATRQYLMKENPASLAFCKRKMKVLYALDKVFQFVFYAVILWTLFRMIFK